MYQMIALLALLQTQTLENPAAGTNGKDEVLIQGTWKLVAVEKNGKRMEREQVVYVISQDEMKHRRGEIQGVTRKFKLDPSQNPKTIDLFGTRHEKGLHILGIYKLSKNDLEICMDENAKGKRPDAFSTKAHPERVLLIFKKQN